MTARALAAWSAGALVVALTAQSPVYVGLALFATANVTVALASGRSLRPLAAGLAVAGGFSVLLNLLLSHGGSHALLVLPAWLPGAGGDVTLESLVFGLTAAGRLVTAVLAVAPLSLAADPTELVDALPAPLERTGAAVAAALNLVPGLGRSYRAVAEAQRLRGWRPRGPRSWGEVLVPVVLTAIEDSMQLAESMEARAYGSGPRTHLRRGHWTPAGAIAAAGAVAAGLVFVTGRVAGLTAPWYPFPRLTPPPVEPVLVAACLLLVLPALLWRSRAWSG